MNRLPPAFILSEPVKQALKEDIGNGDITTEYIVPDHYIASAKVLAKADGVLAGLPFFIEVYNILSPKMSITTICQEGSNIRKGDSLVELTGPAKDIITGERISLNYLQIASGIATYTRQFVDKLQGSRTKICDTRKTTPGFRYLEKYAVCIGGAFPHRYGLYDAILIKDNHIAIAGGIQQAITAVKQFAPHTTKIEVEAENLNQVQAALAVGVDIIMLDNMSVQNIKEALTLIQNQAIVEISGNITLDNMSDYAALGAQYISTSALVFKAQPLDLSMEIS